jgi:hypothetical protein
MIGSVAILFGVEPEPLRDAVRNRVSPMLAREALTPDTPYDLGMPEQAASRLW